MKGKIARRLPLTVLKALDLLERIVYAKRSVGLAELASAAGLDKATAYRLAEALAERGFLRKDPETRRYVGGAKLIELGQLTAERFDLREVARPYMVRLAKETGESVHLTVVDGDAGVYIEKVEGAEGIGLWTRVGARYPLTAGASRLVLLAHLRPEEIRRIISGGLVRFTDRTVTDPNELERRLKEIRRLGYAVSHGELHEGASAVSAPIFNSRGELVAGLSVGGPTFRFSSDVVEALIPKVVATAREISVQLGWRVPDDQVAREAAG